MIASPWRSLSPREQAGRALAWVQQNVPHRNLSIDVPGDRGLTEEQLIESRVGWCNEQARICVALCEVLEIPGRMCFLFHENGCNGHACCELLVEGKWVFHDATFNIRVSLPDGSLATAAELSGPYRHLLKAHYEPAAEWFESNAKPFATTGPRQTVVGAGLFHMIGVSNYVCDGVDVLETAVG
jgi:transglutaminase-like putative cysteine protease